MEKERTSFFLGRKAGSNDEPSLITVRVNGKVADTQYAIALWTMRNTAYRRAGRVVMTAAAYNLKKGLEYGSWELTSKRETLGKNKVFVPVVKTGGRNSEEFATWVRQLSR
jgi:hypothetical protein